MNYLNADSIIRKLWAEKNPEKIQFDLETKLKRVDSHTALTSDQTKRYVIDNLLIQLNKYPILSYFILIGDLHSAIPIELIDRFVSCLRRFDSYADQNNFKLLNLLKYIIVKNIYICDANKIFMLSRSAHYYNRWLTTIIKTPYQYELVNEHWLRCSDSMNQTDYYSIKFPFCLLLCGLFQSQSKLSLFQSSWLRDNIVFIYVLSFCSDRIRSMRD